MFRKLLPKNSTVTEDSSNNSIGKFSCSNCHKTFPQAYRLRRHVREVHEKEKMYQCDECDKKFFKTNSLNRHKTQVHDQLRPYASRNCSSKFKDKSALNYGGRGFAILFKQGEGQFLSRLFLLAMISF